MTSMLSVPAGTTAGDRLLRLALRADAVLTAGAGVVLLAVGGALSGPLGPSSGLLRLLGAAFVAYGVVVWLVAAPARISRGAAGAVITANVLSTVVVVTELLGGWLSLTTAGVVVAVLMAVYTAVFADLQFLGLWRTRRR